MFVSLTPLGRISNGIPEITVETNQSSISCVNLNNETDPIDEDLLTVRVETNTIQNQTFPNSFKIGYENLTIMPGMRFTNDLPLDVSAISLREAIFSLYGWECANQPDSSLLEQISFHRTYESGSEVNRDVSTSLCGHASLRNPQRLWQVDDRDAFTIGNSPFLVSTFSVVSVGKECQSCMQNVPHFHSSICVWYCSRFVLHTKERFLGSGYEPPSLKLIQTRAEFFPRDIEIYKLGKCSMTHQAYKLCIYGV